MILAAVSYTFQPWSDIAAIYTGYGSEPDSINMTAKVTSAGFWTVTHGHPTWVFSSFTPGIYTVVGGDEWGALVILHFTVSSGSQKAYFRLTNAASFSLCSLSRIGHSEALGLGTGDYNTI